MSHEIKIEDLILNRLNQHSFEAKCPFHRFEANEKKMRSRFLCWDVEVINSQFVTYKYIPVDLYQKLIQEIFTGLEDEYLP